MRLFIILFLSFCCAICATAQGSSIRTASFSVKGNCGECKNRIENAADIKGVKYASWDEKTQIITVTYRADKINQKDIEQAIAAAGHDTEHVPASAAAYVKIPSCCKYRDKQCESDKR